MIDFIQNFEKMSNVPGQSIESSDDENIEVVSPSICHQLVESWPLRLRTGNYVGVLAHDFASALFGHFAEVEQLGFDVLVSSAHTCVDSGAFLHFNSFFLDCKYASMARRTNSATGAPVFSDNFRSFTSCCAFKNKAVRFISQHGITQAYIRLLQNSSESSLLAQYGCGIIIARLLSSEPWSLTLPSLLGGRSRQRHLISQEFRDKMTALRSLPVTSKLAVYRVAPAGAPPKWRVIRASKASKRGSPCKCLSRGSRAK